MKDRCSPEDMSSSIPSFGVLRVVATATATTLSACGGETMAPVPLPLPELIVFESTPPQANANTYRDLYVMKPDGSDTLRLTSDGLAFAPAWSPEGESIAFSRIDDFGVSNIHIVEADGSGTRALTSAGGTKSQPSWSPDGRKMAFAGFVDGHGIYTIGTGGNDSGQPKKLHACDTLCAHPAWSPDGSRIAFVVWTDYPTIHIMNANGSSLVPLSSGLQSEAYPAWSPDGSILAFSGATFDSSYDIYLVYANGSGLIRLTDSGTVDWMPSFSRDGSKITFGSWRDDGESIYVMDFDGGNQTRITNFPGTHRMPRWRP